MFTSRTTTMMTASRSAAVAACVRMCAARSTVVSASASCTDRRDVDTSTGAPGSP